MSSEGRTLNPWLTMCTEPRATIQQIVDTDPTRFVLVLAGASGICEALNRASYRSTGDTLDVPTIFLISIFLGPLGGLLTLYVGAALIGWTGRWIGGKASNEQIRAAHAWSMVPFLWVSLLWVPELMLFGEEMFTTEMPRTEASLGLSGLLVLFGLAELAGSVWVLVVYSKSLGQVQGFSAWKALGNVLLASLVIVVPVFLIAILIALLIPA